MDIVKRLALRLKMHKVGGAVVYHVALLKKSLDKAGYVDSRLIKGYCIVAETGEVCEHYWVNVDGLDLDVALEMSKDEMAPFTPVLVEELPKARLRSDLSSPEILEENRRLYNLYQKDPKQFWKEAPPRVRAFVV